MRGIQDEVEGEMAELEREPGPVLRAPNAMRTTFWLPLRDTAASMAWDKSVTKLDIPTWNQLCRQLFLSSCSVISN